MNIAEWIMAAGVAFAISLLMFSVIKNDPWKDHVYENAPPIVMGTPSPHKAGREKMACASCHAIIDPNVAAGPQVIPPIVDGAPIPISHNDGRGKQACSMCHQIISRKVAAQNRQNTPVPISVALVLPAMPYTPPSVALDPEWHEGFGLVRFQGVIIRIVKNTGQYQPNNINVLIDDRVNTPTWYNLAPGWFLQEIKCAVDFGLFVKGIAFEELWGQNTGMQYIKTLSINGQLCDIRGKEMMGFWEPGAIGEEE